MKSKYSLIATVMLCIAPLSAFAATLVDTGVPETQTTNGSPYRGGKVTFTSNVQINAVQHFARVRTAGEITFTLRHDDAGLPARRSIPRSPRWRLALPRSGWASMDCIGPCQPARTG